MAEYTYYDRNWTVLQKIKFLEKWFRSNSIDLSTIDITTSQVDNDVTLTVSGKDFEGNEHELPLVSFVATGTTVEIEKTITGDPGTEAKVENLGTETAVKLQFTVPQGPQGIQGIQGEAATIEVGETVTLKQDEEAYVVNSGNENEAVFDFGIPRGKAATIEVGEVETVTSADPAEVVNSGTEEDAVFDFKIPQGKAATVEVGTVETVLPEEDAEVTNSGTDEDAVFDFKIPQGKAATIEIGEVETLDPGEDAYVTNVGTTGEAKFDFGIPHGEQGIQGEPGVDGIDATVAVGEVETLEPGEYAYVTDTGDEHSAVLNFGIPQGIRGDDGEPAEVAIGTVTTLPYTEDAYVTNSGTAYKAVFNFGIPRGVSGEGVSVVAVSEADGVIRIELSDGSAIYGTADGILSFIYEQEGELDEVGDKAVFTLHLRDENGNDYPGTFDVSSNNSMGVTIEKVTDNIFQAEVVGAYECIITLSATSLSGRTYTQTIEIEGPDLTFTGDSNGKGTYAGNTLTCDSGLIYTSFNSNTLTCTCEGGRQCTLEDIVIDKAYLSGVEYTVTSVNTSNSASDTAGFYGNTTIKTVKVNDRVTSIGTYGFYGCSSLESIDIPALTSLGSRCFYDCSSLESIYIPLVTSLGARCFYDCTSLKSADISSVEGEIESNTFYSCSAMVQILIGTGLTSVGTYGIQMRSGSSNVYYRGTEEDRANIDISSTGTSTFTGATWHYEWEGDLPDLDT